MKVKIFFDFHDVFVDARSAWIKAFTYFIKNDSIKNDYISMMSKKDICRKYNLDYKKVEEKYREYLSKKQDNINFAKLLSIHYDISLCSLSARERLEKDLKKFDLCNLFSEIYSKNDVVSKKRFLINFSKRNDLIIYFTHEIEKIVEYGNVIYIPIKYKYDKMILNKYNIKW